MATVEYFRGGEGWYIRPPYYDAGFVDSIKASLPQQARLWSGKNGCWWVAEAWLEYALRLAEYFYGVRQGETPPAAVVNPPQADPWAILGLRPDAGLEQVKAAYRRMARRHHPDLGGDTPAMQSVNEAYQKIMAELERRGRVR